MRMGNSRAARAALGAAVAAGVRHVAHRFIVAESPAGAEELLGRLWRSDVGASVDLLGEATVSAAQADRYAARCVDALRALAEVYASLQPRPGWRPMDSARSRARTCP